MRKSAIIRHKRAHDQIIITAFQAACKPVSNDAASVGSDTAYMMAYSIPKHPERRRARIRSKTSPPFA